MMSNSTIKHTCGGRKQPLAAVRTFGRPAEVSLRICRASASSAEPSLPFIRELNVILERYKNILAQEKRQRKARNEYTMYQS